MSDIAIKVENLTKEFQIGLERSGDFRESFGNTLRTMLGTKGNKETFTALDDISFEVKKGEALGIIGRNGAGKSTLLKILSRITEPTKGRIEINGRVSALLEVGTGFHPELTGRENIYLNGTILGMTRREVKAKFDEIVDFSGVEKFINTPVKHYSSGMKVRLAFSVAAHLEPEILIIDEVLAVGDAEFQKKCLGKMDDVSKKEGRTVIFVSHNMGAILSLCNQGIVLENGSIQYDGYSNDAIEYYHNLSNIKANVPFKEKLKPSISSFEVLDFHSLNKNLVPEVNYICGQKVIFELTYKNQPKVERVDLAVGLIIRNKNNQFVSVLNNKIVGTPITKLAVKGRIRCTIEKLPLMYGEYNISLIIQYKGGIIYNIENALTIYVSEGDYFNSGFPNAMQRQGVYIKNSWIASEYI